MVGGNQEKDGRLVSKKKNSKGKDHQEECLEGVREGGNRRLMRGIKNDVMEIDGEDKRETIGKVG